MQPRKCARLWLVCLVRHILRPPQPAQASLGKVDAAVEAKAVTPTELVTKRAAGMTSGSEVRMSRARFLGRLPSHSRRPYLSGFRHSKSKRRPLSWLSTKSSDTSTTRMRLPPVPRRVSPGRRLLRRARRSIPRPSTDGAPAPPGCFVVVARRRRLALLGRTNRVRLSRRRGLNGRVGQCAQKVSKRVDDGEDGIEPLSSTSGARAVVSH